MDHQEISVSALSDAFLEDAGHGAVESMKSGNNRKQRDLAGAAHLDGSIKNAAGLKKLISQFSLSLPKGEGWGEGLMFRFSFLI